MTPRRRSLCLLSGFLAAGALAAWLVLGHKPEVPPATVSGHLLRVERSPDDFPLSVIRRIVQTPASPVSVERQAAPVISLCADSAAEVAQEIELLAELQKADLRLTSGELSRFAAVVMSHQAIRHAFEAEIATVASTQRGGFRMEIPVYARAGDALRTAFYSELRQKLGDTVAAEITSKLGGRLENRFAGFGVSVQTLEFLPEWGPVGRSYAVTRSLVFWNGIDSEDRLVQRSETYFPAIEDPSGSLWGPFLSRLASDREQRSGT